MINDCNNLPLGADIIRISCCEGLISLHKNKKYA
jgi:hypothetical protein